MIATFPRMPTDVERLLLEFAAESDRGLALKLVILSKYVQSCIDPIVYRYVCLINTRQLDAFIRTLDHSHKPGAFFSNRVKHLCLIGRFLDEPRIINILRICSGLKSLAIWPSNTPHLYPNLARSIQYGPFRLKRISAMPSLIYSENIEQIQQLTHIDLILEPRNVSWGSLLPFHRLSALTHLCIDLAAGGFVTAMESELIKVLLVLPQSVRVFLVNVFDMNDCSIDPSWIKGALDPRVVFGSDRPMIDTGLQKYVVQRPFPDCSRDWSYLPWGELDAWTLAEDVIMLRRLEKPGSKVIS